jgi:hypothetical protein
MAPASANAAAARPSDNQGGPAAAGNAVATDSAPRIIEPKNPFQPPNAAAPQSPATTIRF